MSEIRSNPGMTFDFTLEPVAVRLGEFFRLVNYVKGQIHPFVVDEHRLLLRAAGRIPWGPDITIIQRDGRVERGVNRQEVKIEYACHLSGESHSFTDEETKQFWEAAERIGVTGEVTA